MKTKYVKYIFFGIVILLIGLAIYILYKDNNKQDINISNEKTNIITDTDINIGITGYDTINPILSSSKDVQYISKLIYDSLITIDSEFKPQNNLAKECSKINEKDYIIKLENNIYWHDNTLFTAKDVKFTIDAIKNFQGTSIYKENVEKIDKVEIIDDNTIKIFLTEDIPFFEYKLTFPILAKDSYNEKTLESTANIPNGTGKYKIKSINNEQIEMEKKASNIESKIEKIYIKIYNSPADLYNSLIREKIDFINTNNIDYESYIGKIGFNINTSPDREFDYIGINNNNKVLANKEVRQALNYAIDKKNIIYTVYNNKYSIGDFPLNYGSYLYDDERVNFEYNLNEAKNILTQNGWEYKNNSWKKSGTNYKLDFNLVVNENHIKRILVAENIKSGLKQINININIIKVNDSEFESYLQNKDYDLILTGSKLSVSPELNSYLGENNIFNYRNETIINLLKEINEITDNNILKEKYREIIKIYGEEIPFISLYFNSNIIISNTNLKGNMWHSWYSIFYNMNGWYKTAN